VDQGAALSVTPQLTNPGVPAATFSKASGPSWASVNASTGEVTGTVEGPTGTTSVVVRADNGVGSPADLTIGLTILAAGVTPPDPEADSPWVRLPRDAEVWVRIPRA
jgi:hypothetical protein